MSDATIEAIASNCPHLEKLVLVCGAGLNNLSISYLSSLLHLRELDIMHCPDISITDIQTLVQSIPNIESFCFEISREENEGPSDILIFQAIGSCCPRLRVLKCASLASSIYEDGSVMPVFAGCPLLEGFRVYDESPNDGVLFAVGKSCPRLRCISFDGREDTRPRYTDLGLIALSRGCPGLTDLRLITCDPLSVTDKAILSFAEHCHRLEAFYLVHNLITGRAVCALLKANPNLISVGLGGDLLNGEVILCLALQCRKLISLDLAGCRNLTEAMLSTIFTRCTRLETLALVSADVTDALVETLLLYCKSLSEIDSRMCPKITGLAVSHMFRLGKRLIHISLKDCSLLVSDEFSRYYFMKEVSGSRAGNNKILVDLHCSHWSISWTPRTPLAEPPHPSGTTSK